MLWALFALLAGITNCVQMQLNTHYKHDGFEINAWRSLVSTGLMLPFFFLMEWPSDPRYYMAALLGAAINVVGMMVQYNLAAKKNGRVAILYQPVTIFLTFCLWLAIDRSQFDFFSMHPLHLVGILASFALLFVSLHYTRRNSAGWRALMTILPVGVLYAFLGVITKLVLDNGTGVLAISLGFVLLSNAMMTAISFPVLIARRQYKPLNRKIMKPAAYISVFHTVSWVLINIATIYAPNAAYPFAITALAPVWFMIYYKMRGIKDDASPYAGALMFAAAILLVLVSKG